MLGGTGTDTLRLDGNGSELDLGSIPDPRIEGIERSTSAATATRSRWPSWRS